MTAQYQKTAFDDGSGGTTVVSAADPLPTTVAGGGGTQYDIGAAIPADGTGTLALWKDGSGNAAAPTAATPLPVDVVSGGASLASTGTITTQADQASNATLLSSDATRKSWEIWNDSNQILYLKAGATATSTDWTWKLAPDASIFCDFYYGRVDGIWAADGTGQARITSFT